MPPPAQVMSQSRAGTGVFEDPGFEALMPHPVPCPNLLAWALHCAEGQIYKGRFIKSAYLLLFPGNLPASCCCGLVLFGLQGLIGSQPEIVQPQAKMTGVICS